MDKQCKLILTLFLRHPVLSCNDIADLTDMPNAADKITYLIENGYIESASEPPVLMTPDTKLTISITGNAFLESRHRDSIRFAIPVIISVIALVKSFFPQLVLLWKLITQLWK